SASWYRAAVRAGVGPPVLRTPSARAAVLRAQRVQRRAEPNPSAGRVSLREDTHDRPRALELPPGGHTMGDRLVPVGHRATEWHTMMSSPGRASPTRSI